MLEGLHFELVEKGCSRSHGDAFENLLVGRKARRDKECLCLKVVRVQTPRLPCTKVAQAL